MTRFKLIDVTTLRQPRAKPHGVFQVTPNGTLTGAIYNFDSTHGATPLAGLVLGTDGNLYGTTYGGGASGLGTVFQITPGGVLTTLHSFNGSDGAHPKTSLVQASDGSFYRVTWQGGAFGRGTVFRIHSGVFVLLFSFQHFGNPLGAWCKARRATCMRALRTGVQTAVA